MQPNNALTSISIILLFAMLWLPLGQYDFLLDHWMKVGTYAVPFLLMGAFAIWEEKKDKSTFSKYRMLSILMLIIYIIHQFEEHWIDIFGNTYAFYTFNNQFILSALGEAESSTWPLTKGSIFIINTALVWLVGCISILKSPKNLFPYYCMAAIIFINGIVHILAGAVNVQYNPGLLTSLILFVPFYLFVLKKTKRDTSYHRKLMRMGLLWAFLAHVIMVGGLLAANWFHVIPETVYFVLLILWSILPAFLFEKK
ncbi:MAG: HXXEE domain-containing protein [Bacteroidota bacterium]